MGEHICAKEVDNVKVMKVVHDVEEHPATLIMGCTQA